MLPPLKYFAVNWIDGMKINKDHFEQSDIFIKEKIRDANAMHLNSWNYGLCYSDDNLFKSLNIKITIDVAKIIRVQLLSCRAITAGGCRIEYGNTSGLKQNFDQDKLTAEYFFDDTKEKNFYVVLTVNIFARVPMGQPDANENPPRFPFVNSEYKLQILPESQIDISNSASDALVIGQLNYANGKMRVVEDYIPSCTCVKSSPLLYDEYYKLGNLLGETLINIGVIFEKIHGKSQATSLVKSCSALCADVNNIISDTMAQYRWTLAEAPPVFLFESFLRLAYKMNTSLSTMPVKDKEELLNYICEWVDETPATLNEKMKKLIKLEYNHTAINESLVLINEFMQMVYAVFNKLSQLDFIGKKKGERAFVQEKTAEVQPTPPVETKKQGGWSFLADD